MRKGSIVGSLMTQMLSLLLFFYFFVHLLFFFSFSFFFSLYRGEDWEVEGYR